MKYVIDDIITPFTSRIHSHRSSWPRTQLCMLKDAGYDAELAFGDLEMIHDADVWVISHGMEFKDTYNLNGGWLPEHVERLKAFIAKGPDGIVSLERPMPDIVGLLRPRAEKTEWNLTDEEWDRVQAIVDNARVMTHNALVGYASRLVIGDSHSVARYRTKTVVDRHDGLTLHGLLKRGVLQLMNEAGFESVEKLVIQAGNIDIRHHLGRQPDPMNSIAEMLEDLYIQLEDLRQEGRIFEYEVTAPYPIEFEGRKLPKTGYYKGTPFFGSWNERNEYRKLMTQIMLNKFKNVKTWPDRWFEIDPEAYAEDFMEKPRSVHLSPARYEWDLENNCER